MNEWMKSEKWDKYNKLIGLFDVLNDSLRNFFRSDVPSTHLSDKYIK
jgi:hypothetical protein